MPSSLSRRRERRRRYTAIASAALAVIGVVGWQLSVMGPKPGSHAPMEICALNNTTLRADVDADGHQDEIYDKTREGDPLVVFKGGDTVRVEKARGRWQKFRGLWSDDMETRGTFGDFDGDGYVDLALFYSQHDTGDSPEDNMITHEVHYGPLATDLSSARTGTIRMPYGSFVSGVRATDVNHDGRAELQIFQSTGDGTEGHYVGRQDGDGISAAVFDQESGGYTTGGWHRLKLDWLDLGTCHDAAKPRATGR
ncbi:hypothetical protein OKJ48_20750 [Streptomyces kunmingensis]|uniref:VCBS repeat-containing protein n=1 Tax=Streptomyces kunmingensis TaxID=68225 RepID=A0ABU6CEP3_9ACTN|nr:hypothetical protein [Streptomyces kunmingensis]MEB3962661.1 hypothetical protein [Streptomyces kunmingensis]